MSDLKELVLRPSFKALKERRLSAQVDYLVYSVGFPTRVRFDSKGTKHRWVNNAVGSITGMSYLYAFLDEDKQLFLSPEINRYFGGKSRLQTVADPESGVAVEPVDPTDFAEPLDFRSNKSWGPGGRVVERGKGGLYLIAGMLGVTRGETANTVEEVLVSLERAVAADFSKPEGSFVFMNNGDLRSRTRQWAFEDAVVRLKDLGYDARVEKGDLPVREKSILGLVTGSAKLDVSRLEDRLAAGAFCDNLTSFGARFSESNRQSTIADFVRVGASSAFGAVSEPYGLQFKFPTPYLSVYYASGLSLGEAYYRSVASPYNLLLVGDPLCQPFASPPDVKIGPGVNFDEVARGKLRLVPETSDSKVRSFVFVINGRFVGQCPVGGYWVLDTRGFKAGEYKISVIASRADNIATQGRWERHFVLR